jgi:hypothetical protein
MTHQALTSFGLALWLDSHLSMLPLSSSWQGYILGSRTWTSFILLHKEYGACLCIAHPNEMVSRLVSEPTLECAYYQGALFLDT